MELQITGQNIEILPTVRGRIERKLGKLGRHFTDITGCKVELVEEKTKSPQQRFVAQVTLDVNGTLLRGEERGDNLLSAIDKVVSVIDRQIERYKGKRYNKGRGSSFARDKGMTEEGPSAEEVVKVKRFVVKPMSISDAIEQMELLGHDFFLFHNAETRELNLLYRRIDGNYSIIEPELG